MCDKQAMPAAYVIARNPAAGGMTKESRIMGSVSEIAAVASLPRNDGTKKSRNHFGNTP
jgi:hypothetical protein